MKEGAEMGQNKGGREELLAAGICEIIEKS